MTKFIDGEELFPIPGTHGYCITKSARVYAARGRGVSKRSREKAGKYQWLSYVQREVTGLEKRLDASHLTERQALDWVRRTRIAYGVDPDYRELVPHREVDKNGEARYLRVSVPLDGKVPRPTRLHQLMGRTFLGNPKLVRHLDDNKLNNSLSNLRAGTQVDNMDDARDRTRTHVRAAYSDDEWAVFVHQVRSGVPVPDMALSLGVTKSTVYRRLRNKRHVRKEIA